MLQSESAIARSPSAPGPWIVIAGLTGLWMLAALISPMVIAVTALAAAGALVLWAAARVQLDGAHLLCALVMIELLASATVLPITEEQRFVIRYPLLLLFALPAAIRAWRNPLLWRGGFRDYLLYLGWAAASVTYSLLPGYTAARVLAAILLFVISVQLAGEVKGVKDIERLLKWLMIGLAVVLAGLAATLVAAPHDLAWSDELMSGMVRFRGFFGSPNQVGEVTLATVCAGAIVWNSAGGREKALLAIEMATAIVLGALADSRSPFVGLAVGGLAYMFWRYRLRALPVCVVAAALMFGVAAQIAPDYFTRGEVSTLTGRTDVWRFAVEKIKERPLTGWGFEVEGQILQSKYFPVWWGPWEEGPHSSLHSGYLSRAVGLGVPAFAFWVFFFLRPWFWLFRSGEDPWQLKRLFLLVVLPVLILNIVETTAGDCRYAVGLLATLCWAFAERQRIAPIDAARGEPRGNVFAAVKFNAQRWE
jgi:O-antigen ligase